MLRIKYGCLSGCAIGLVAVVVANAEPPAAKDVAATIGGKVITLRELDQKVLKTNMKLAQSLYKARKAALDDLILERALASEASEKGTTVEQLIREKIAAQNKPITDEDIASFYQSNKARMRGKSLEQSSGRIRQYLSSQHSTAAKANLLAQLKKKNNVRILLSPPRVEITVADNEPAKGPVDAKVTIVEFSDFQ